MTRLLIVAGMFLLSASPTCLPAAFTTDDARTALAAACLYVGDLGPEAEARHVWRLCAEADPATGVCLVDAYPGTVLMGLFE